MRSDNIIHLCGDIGIDKRKMSILVDGNSYKMNYNEFHILSYLAENSNKIISKDVLISVGWPDNIVTDASLHRAIFSLRAVLSLSNVEIKTISGRGYILVIDNDHTRDNKEEGSKKHSVTCKKSLIKKNIIIISILFFSISIINIVNELKNNLDFIDDNFIVLEIKDSTILKNKNISLPEEFLSKVKSNPKHLFYFFNKNKDFYEISTFDPKTNQSQNYFIEKENWKMFIKSWGREN